MSAKTILNSFLILLSFLYANGLSAEQKNILDITFTTENGVIDAQSLKDQVVYVDFWASWCKPCLKSFPWMNEMSAKYADSGLRIIAVNVDKDTALIDKFLKKAPASFSIALDSNAILAKQFSVKAMPSSFIYGRDGQLAVSHLGFLEKKKSLYESEIRGLLGLEQ